MGWFSGPTVKERSKHGRIEFYGKCDSCGKEQSHAEKRKVERALEACEKADKKAAVRKQEQQSKEEKAAALSQKNALEKRRQGEIDRLRRQRLNTAKEIRRAAKGKKCAWCGKRPCKGTKPKCAAMIAAELESAFDIDVSDKGRFNKQMDFYQKQMEFRPTFWSDEE